MVEPTQNQDPAKQITPEEKVADPKVTQQPVKTEPDVAELKAKIEELERVTTRHKEQIAGKDKLISELQLKKLVSEVNEDPIEDETPTEEVITAPKAKPVDESLLRGTIENSIFINRLKLKESFKEDPHLPFTDEVAKEVEDKLVELDPSGKAKLNVKAWEAAYRLVKADKVANIVAAEVAKATKAVEEQHQKEVESYVETTEQAPAETVPTVTLEDALSGKVKMSTKEILEKFPEVRTHFSDSVLRMYGLI